MKYLIIVRPANAPVLEYVLDLPDKVDPEQVAAEARLRWFQELAGQVELSVSIELEEWAETGHFGTGDDGDSIPD